MTNFETRLWAAAVQEAGTAGMTFTVPCSRNVKDLIRAGVSTMIRERRTAEADREEADAHFARLCAEMIAATRALGEKPGPGGRFNIRETAIVQAKKLCPLWPFG
jgi:hypothetical protein